MPITIGKKTGKAPTPAPSSAPASEANLTNLGAGSTMPPAAPPAAAPGKQTAASFLITGQQQGTAIQRVRAEQDLRAKLRTNAREFWLEPGQFAECYFLDGVVMGDDVFDTPMIVTHLVSIGGSMCRIVCNQQTEGSCIVCDSHADKTQPQSLQLFTVINTTPYVIRQGNRKGQILQARLQVFAATLKVREKLLTKAKNRGGSLAGHLWKFTRHGEKDPRTGDDIEYMATYPMQSVLAKYPKLGDPEPNSKAATATRVFDYAMVYPVLTNAEIAALRPDLGGMAGFVSSKPGMMNTSVGDIGDDEIPF